MVNIQLQERQLNKEQKKAVEFGEGPLLIIAGAGTGKTTVVTERIKYLISSGRAKPQEILALTFTEKASREMEERVDLALPYGVTQMWLSTFHAFCDRILKSEGLAIGLDPNYHLMTQADTIQFFRTNLFAFSLSYFRPLGNPTKFIEGMTQHFSRLKDEDVTPEQYMEWVHGLKIKNQKSKIKNTNQNLKDRSYEKTEEDVENYEKFLELSSAYRTYEELKTKNGVMDYGDLIAYTLKLFRTRKSILRKYQDVFKYLLIDEFQDTNFAQNELAILLAGKKQNITVVGDDDQAIYRWRGAAISNIIQFRKHFPKTKIIVLTKNYRSTKEILDRSYDLIQHNNPDRLECVEHVDKKLECMRRVKGDPIQLVSTDRVEKEAEEVAVTILNIKNKKLKIQIKNQRETDKDHIEYTWRDFAILVRANAHAEPFVRALSRLGIPFQFLGPGQLLRQAEVKDLICYLKVLYDIRDSVSLFRVLSMDYFAIPARDIASLISYARQKGVSLFEICEDIQKHASVANENFDPSSVASTFSPLTETAASSEVGQNFVRSFHTDALITIDGEKKIGLLMRIILKHLTLIKKETAGQILYYFLEESGILKELASYKTEKDERVAENIAKFFDKLKTYETDHDDASVFQVVDWLDLCMDLGESPLASNSDWNTRDAVNILTVHSAKGLEFPIVFLVNLVGARFPTTEKHEQIPIPDSLIKEILPEGDFHLEEERRLFYVGMTRARDYLFLTAAQFYGEGKREKKISPFITETIGQESIYIRKTEPDVQEKQLLLIDWKKSPEQLQQKKEARPVTYLSYSQIESFERCPLQYKYRNIIRIPVPSSAALTFGGVIHKTLQRFYEEILRGTKASEGMLLRIYADSWKSDGYKNRSYEDMMLERGRELLIEFFAKGYDPAIRTLSLEQSFKVKISQTLTLGGKIDRVDRTSAGTLEIIDYKTGTAPKKRDPEEDLQLSVYALAAVEEGVFHEKPENVLVSFYFLEGQEKISAKRTADQLDVVRQKVQSVAEHISKSDFLPTPGKHCDFCEFRLICEAWK